MKNGFQLFYSGFQMLRPVDGNGIEVIKIIENHMGIHLMFQQLQFCFQALSAAAP